MAPAAPDLESISAGRAVTRPEALAWLLAALAFLAAALAFLLQPMVGRMLLPGYGGSSSVWTTALVFFQVLLVAGYAWAHVGPARLGVRRHAAVHVGLVVAALLVLPAAAPAWARPPAEAPLVPWLIATLAAMVGLPFLVLAANGPTVQRWYAVALGSPGRDDEPYRLFAASNAGSLIGLLAYPLFVEPNLELADQARWWTAGFVAFACATAIAAVAVALQSAGAPLRRQITSTAGGTNAVPWPRRATWVALAGVPVAVMVGVTSHLSTDVAAVPLLWVIPLAIYLVTLVLAYARRQPILARPARLLLVPAAGLAVASHAGFVDLSIGATFAIHLGTLLLAGLALHGTLAVSRPGAANLTEYTLLVASGGAIGGLAAGILGPLILPLPLEEPLALMLAIIVAAVVRPAEPRRGRPAGSRGGPRRKAGVAAAAGVGAILVAGLVIQQPAIASVRTFYGTYRVVQQGSAHVLLAGTTIHGIQDWAPGRQGEPWAYYGRRGPLGQVLDTLLATSHRLRIGAVGLGAGALAAYGRPGDAIEFLEIDPAVAALAGDRRLFTYLEDSAARIEVAIGDGRLLLEERDPGGYDVLVLDAFSSDAVPVHLLTVEAIELAMSRVRPGGVIALHISNRYLELEPIVAAAARQLGLVAILGTSLPRAEDIGLAEASQWIIVAREYREVAGLVTGSDWRTAHAGDGKPWTDRRSDLIGALR